MHFHPRHMQPSARNTVAMATGAECFCRTLSLILSVFLSLSVSQIFPLSLPVFPSSDSARLPPSPPDLFFHWCVSMEQITADKVINNSMYYHHGQKVHQSSKQFGNIFLHITSIIQYFFNKVNTVWLHYLLFKLFEFLCHFSDFNKLLT